MFKKLFSRNEKPELVGVRPEARAADYPLPLEVESPPFKDKWAVLNYYVPDGLMHPEDIELYISGGREGESLYVCTKEENDWVTITNNSDFSFRVNPSRVLWIPKPDFSLGQEVETTNGTIRTGKIKSRGWHFKEKRFTFYLEIIGRKGLWATHKRRYWAHDLKPSSS